MSRSIRKEVTGIVFLAVLSVLMLIMTSSAFAATLTVEYEPKDGDDPIQVDTTFTLYHVGDFDGPLLKLTDNYKDVDAKLNFTKKQFIDQGMTPEKAEEEWKKAWMSSAQTLADYLKEEDKIAEVASAPYIFENLEPGLYLLIGTSTAVPKGEKTVYWWPRPMYVRVLGGDRELTYVPKPTSEVATEYIVHKSWENVPKELEDVVIPDSIDIEIWYGGTDEEPEGDIEKVELNNDNNWTYKWTAEKEQNDPSKWHVREVISEEVKDTFSITRDDNYNEATHTRSINIKNVFDRKQLEIVKTMTDYISQGNTSQAFVFKVTAFVDKEVAFTKYVGITFTEDGKATDRTIVKNIPKDVTRIVVEEVESGNYVPDDSPKDADRVGTEDGSGKWEVSFKNSKPEGNEPPSFDTGIINKYSITGEGQFSLSRVGSGVNE